MKTVIAIVVAFAVGIALANILVSCIQTMALAAGG